MGDSGSDHIEADYARDWRPSEEGLRLVAEARKLAPALAQCAAQTDRDRRVPDESFSALKEAGLFRSLRPKRFGGLELGVWEHATISMELSRGCGSSGWVFCLLNEGSWFVSLYSQEAQADVWGADPDATIAGSLRPVAENAAVQRAPNGFRVSGRFSFASGSDHATWIMLAAFTAAQSGGSQEVMIFLVPKAKLQLIDDWHVLGMRGTGSRTYQAADVFVPDHRALRAIDLYAATTPGVAENPDWPLLAAPRSRVVPFIASAPTIGIAQGAVDWFQDHAANVTRKLAESTLMQSRFAESAVEAFTARLLMDRALRETMALVNAQQPISLELTHRMLRDGAYAGILAENCIDRLHRAIGSQGIFDGHPLGRALRDVHTAVAQVGLQWDIGALPFAQAALSAEIDPASVRETRVGARAGGADAAKVVRNS